LDLAPKDSIKKDIGLTSFVKQFIILRRRLGKPFARRILSRASRLINSKDLQNSSLNTAHAQSTDDKLAQFHRHRQNLCDGAPRDKTSLVLVNKEGNEVTKAKHKAFDVNFKAEVSEGDGAEVIRLIGARFSR
jgi:hypothetical protein